MIRPHQTNQPLWVKAVSLLKKEEDKGIGSTIERVLKETKIDTIAHVYETISGRPCGCQQRKEKLNNKFSY